MKTKRKNSSVARFAFEIVIWNRREILLLLVDSFLLFKKVTSEQTEAREMIYAKKQACYGRLKSTAV